MTDSTESSESDGTSRQPRSSDIARQALEDARAAAKAAGKSVGQGKASPSRRGTSRGRGNRRSWSGAGPDGRDPQPLGAIARGLARRNGWGSALSEGTIFGSWSSVVGEDVAAHCTPTRLSDKVLHISAESTSWATNLRLVQDKILSNIAASVGHGVVTSVRITGPQAPSWRKGKRHVRGRGPRDTYG